MPARLRASCWLSLLLACACNTILGNEARSPIYREEGDERDAGALDTDAGENSPTEQTCAELTCGAFAACRETESGAKCECREGYVERDGGGCQDRDECAAAGNGDCDPNAACVNLSGKHECVCKPGYRQEEPNEDSESSQPRCIALCDEAGCDAHASCTIVDERALCTCLAPYTGNGLSCTFDAACADHNCDQNARCLGGGPSPCVCSDGFKGDGSTCTPVDPCEDAPCKNDGKCSADKGTFFCDCEGTGFRGTRCEQAIDDCTPNPCKHGACHDLVKDYECKCAAGYEGKSCETDSDDCAQNPCARGTCVDLVGDYKCTCPEGYSGKNCDNDIDDCAGNPCARGTCVNKTPGYECQCPAGYDGKNCENNRDDCAQKPCVHGTCSDLVDGFSCSCEAGYDGKTCEHDIDDCANDPCEQGTCVDKVNGHSCECSVGWGGPRCDMGSCSNVKCPSSAPCRVPTYAAGICYPSSCGDREGLCIAENRDGSGATEIEQLNDDNSDFDWGDDENWTKRARFFAYVRVVDDYKHVCVFPEEDHEGSPLIIPLGESRTTSYGYGSSNAFPGEKGCPE